MKKFIKYVGMDVHKETIAVSVAPSNRNRAASWGSWTFFYFSCLNVQELSPIPARRVALWRRR
jgi:hypothetical protein